MNFLRLNFHCWLSSVHNCDDHFDGFDGDGDADGDGGGGDGDGDGDGDGEGEDDDNDDDDLLLIKLQSQLGTLTWTEIPLGGLVWKGGNTAQ